jgi:hypothetical protein
MPTPMTFHDAFATGRELSRLRLPPPVYALFGGFDHIASFRSVATLVEYRHKADLFAKLDDVIIPHAERILASTKTP